MGFRSAIRRGMAGLVIGLLLATGCSAPSTETGPSEEPNVGPGGPAGGTLGTNGGAPAAKGGAPAATPKKADSGK